MFDFLVNTDWHTRWDHEFYIHMSEEEVNAKIIQSRLEGQAHQYQLMKADYKIRQKRILEHESSYSKTGGHVLTTKFGKPKVIIGLESLLATASRNQPMGVIKSLIVGFLLYSVKEIDLLKETYLEETEFKENAAWQVIY